MTRGNSLFWTTFVITLLVASAVPSMAASPILRGYVVGTCKPPLPLAVTTNYATISAGVAAVPSNSILYVCPGTYAEQVTITKPLTLQGLSSPSANNPVITLPSAGLVPSPFQPQSSEFAVPLTPLIAADTNGSGAVALQGLTIDGGTACNSVPSLPVGIFYLSTPGSISSTVVQNMGSTVANLSACSALGIAVENDSGVPRTVSVTNNLIQNIGVDFDESFSSGGIYGVGLSADSLTLNVLGNVLNNPGLEGIVYRGSEGTVSRNLITIEDAGGVPAANFGSAVNSNSTITISQNSIQINDLDYGINVSGSAQVTNNNIAGPGEAGTFTTGIGVSGGGQIVSNTITNVTQGIETGATPPLAAINSNIIDNARFGIYCVPAGSTMPNNTFVNVAETETVCP